MEVTLSSQIVVFLGSLALGATLSLFYDIFRVFDVILMCKPKRVFLEDVIYLVLCAIATFVYMLITSMGEIRGYILIAMLLGWTFFHVSISKWGYPFFWAVVNYFRKNSKHRARANKGAGSV